LNRLLWTAGEEQERRYLPLASRCQLKRTRQKRLQKWKEKEEREKGQKREGVCETKAPERKAYAICKKKKKSKGSCQNQKKLYPTKSARLKVTGEALQRPKVGKTHLGRSVLRHETALSLGMGKNWWGGSTSACRNV